MEYIKTRIDAKAPKDLAQCSEGNFFFNNFLEKINFYVSKLKRIVIFCSNCELILVVKKKPIKVSGRETRRTLATCFKCRREVSSQNLRRHFRFHKVPAEEAEAELAKVYGRSKERILSECPHCHKLVKYDLKFLSLVHITESSFLS